jgi:two-component system nitrate/nitrite response regulator NarP
MGKIPGSKSGLQNTASPGYPFLHLTARMKQNRIAVVIADDHAILRESLTALLQSQADIAVVGTAADGDEALQLVQRFSPQVLVLDLYMPGSDGFAVLRTLERAGNRVASVVLTGSESQNDYVQVVRLGARGLVLKADAPEKLFAAIRAVAEGELAFSDEVSQYMLDAMVSDQTEVPTSLDRLSKREREVSSMVARGMRNRDIATGLQISENTVKRHLQSIFSKTGSRDRLELAVLTLSDTGKAA